MEKVNFDNVLVDVSAGNIKLLSINYLDEGFYPIVDQGKELIIGFTNKEQDLVKSIPPYIIFGDHTRILKYIDFPFAMGADGIKVLKVRDENILFAKYVYYYLNFVNIPNTGYNRHFKYLKDIQIPLPPLEEQKRIATLLDTADSLRQKDKELLQKYDALAQSLFLEMFGDTINNPKKWDLRLVEELAKKEKHSMKAGPFGSSLKKEFYVSKGYKIYGQEQVIKNDFNFGNYYIDEKRFKSLESCKVNKGDILISLVGTYGKIAIVPDVFEPGIINPRLMKITPNTDIIRSDFFKILLQSKTTEVQLKSQSRGGTMDIINLGIIKKVQIPVPPIELQNQFAEQIQLIEKQKELVQENLAKSEALFMGLLGESFKY